MRNEVALGTKRPEDRLTWLNHQPYRSTLLTIYGYLGKSRNADDVDPIQCKIASRNSNSFDRLINRTGPDGLYLSAAIFTDHTRNCASN
jgi:hypothetical protein